MVCQGGGSSALEAGAHGSCAQSPPRENVFHSCSGHMPEYCTTTHAHEEACELCIDIPLDVEFSKTPAPQFKKISAALDKQQGRELHNVELIRTQLPHPPPYISTTLMIQRTTVLII